MPRNGSGVYVPVANSVSPATTGTTISSTAWNAYKADLESAMTQSVSSDGQTPMTGQLNMGSQKILSLGSGTTSSDAANLGQVQAQAYAWGSTAGGTATAITINPSPAIAAYAAGQAFRFICFANSTGAATTLAVSGLAAKSLLKIGKGGGNINPAALDMMVGATYAVIYDGTQFILLNPQTNSVADPIASAGTIDCNAATGDYAQVTGTTTITAITLANGRQMTLEFAASLTLTNGASLILPGGANILTQAGDVAVFRGEASSVVRCIGYTPASGNSVAPTIPRNHIEGLTLVNNGAASMDIQAGACADATNKYYLQNASTFTKTQNSFAAGSGNGGKMSAAAVQVNTWYYFWALRKDTDGSIDFGFDVSPTAPTAQAGYNSANYRYIGMRKTKLAATDWEPFTQNGDEVVWQTPPALDVNGAAPSTANRTLISVNVGARKVKWFGYSNITLIGSGSQFLLFTDPANPDIAPGNGASPLATHAFSQNSASTFQSDQFVSCWTNTSQQIGIRGTTAAVTSLQTIGWIDSRGKA